MSASECAVKPFKREYLLEVLRIEAECFNPEERYSRRVFEWYLLLEPIFYIAECGGEVVGYVLATIQGDTCHVDSIAVREKWRRRGIGAELLKRALSECRSRGAKRAALEVAVDNEPALRLYSKLGFRVKEVIPKYYPSRDAYLMEREL
ncbi:MAG: ribosomal protein S18-alanine N-acetyltransferase [Desulfurococcaceae archaeon]|nr:ribosomal protein S18-alanine N-acetyltransferase [Desulfurococcaceae archaeon]